MMMRRIVACVLLLAACNRGTSARVESDGVVTPGGTENDSEPAQSPRPLTRLAYVSRPAVQTPPEPEPEPELLGSLRLMEQATVMSDATGDATALGLIASGTRLARAARVVGEGCRSGWIPVQPRGLVCAKTEADRREPSQALLPRLPRGAVVPGTYGKIRSQDAVFFPSEEAAKNGQSGRSIASSLTVRRLGVVRTGGKPFWRTRHGLIDAEQVRRYHGSRFAGVEVSDGLAQPIAWTIGNGDRFSVAVKRAPKTRTRTVRRVKLRHSFVVLETSEDGRFVRIGDDEWLSRADVRVATHAEAPEGIGASERWLDIDLDQQTLVAYEGTTPVYATLISSGKVLHRTPTGVFRISRKVASRTMNSMSDSKESYSVDEVPWTAYFAKGYALHAAFWHQGFGRTRSHGCVNLSPKDARHLYTWMAPAVAPGWREVYGNEEQPGSVIRIRNQKYPEPNWKGYAAALVEEPAVELVAG